MGFKYVLIPASPNEPMQELEFASEILDLTKDTFREQCESYFASLGGHADRAVLLSQLQEKTGIDLKAKAAAGEMDQRAVDNLLSMTSVEIFPVMLPTKAVGFEGISMYCDDKGIAKELEVNERASGLIQACGYPGQIFRGDTFMGRVFDDNEDEWRRTDFSLSECNSDAPWVAKVKQQRSNRSSSDMSSMAAKMGVGKDAARITPDMLEHAPTGETEAYKWRQTSDEVEVTFKCELQKSEKKLVKVTFKRQQLKVEVKGEVVIDAQLFMPCTVDECTWTLSDGVLQVNLAKAEEENWQALLQ